MKSQDWQWGAWVRRRTLGPPVKGLSVISVCQECSACGSHALLWKCVNNARQKILIFVDFWREKQYNNIHWWSVGIFAREEKNAWSLAILKIWLIRIWTGIWAGGITNPLTVIEQLTCLMFIRSLDEKEPETEQYENLSGEAVDKIFPPSPAGQSRRWSKYRARDTDADQA